MVRKAPDNEGPVLLRHRQVIQAAENLFRHPVKVLVGRCRDRQEQGKPIAALLGRLFPGEAGTIHRLPVYSILQMQGIAVDLHRAHGRRNGPGRSVRPHRKAAAPSLLIGQVFLQVFQQGRPRIRVPGGVKGGVQPPAEEGPVAKRQPLVVRGNSLRVRRVVLPAPALCLAEPEVLFQPGDHLFCSGDVGVLLIVFQHPADQGLPHILPPPGGVGQKLLLQEPGHRQGLLHLLRLEKRLGLRRFCLRGHSDAFLVGIQVPVQLEEVHRNLSADPRHPPDRQLPDGAVEDLGPAQHGALEVQPLPRGTVDLLRQILPPQKVDEDPKPGGVALTVRGHPLLTAFPDIGGGVAVQHLPERLDGLLVPAPRRSKAV